jgi:hypothetical protein
MTREQKKLYMREWRRKRYAKDPAYPEFIRWSKRRQYRNRYAATLLGQARKRALKANLPFDLVEADIAVPEFCPVLGIRLEISEQGRWTDNSPSLDRFVPALGYVKNNVQVISWRANRIKCDASVEEIRALLCYMESA